MDLIDAREEEKQELQQELVKIAKKHKLKKKLISVLIIVSVFIVSILSAWLVGNVQAKKNYEVNTQKDADKTAQTIQEKDAAIKELEAQIQELINTPVVENRISPKIALEIIESELNNIGELATTEYVFTDAARFSDSKQIAKWNWNIPGTEKSFVAKWDGKIKVGIQIDKIKIDIVENEYKILISIPSAEILSYEVNNVEMLDEKNNVFNPISIDDKIKLDKETEDAMVERAIENGLLTTAQQNAEGIIASLICVNSEITSDYTLEFIKE